ncbi:MAG: tyrosine-type recombinase/integrase [Lachnospiraceae bacterium]
MSRKGENIFHRRDGRWEGRYQKGRKADRSILYGYIYGKSYQEVKDKLIELKYIYRQDDKTKKKAVVFNGTVLDFSNEYMGMVKISDIKQSTYANYNSMMEIHIRPYLGNRKLTALTVDDISEFVVCLKQKGLGSGAIHSVVDLLKRMLNDAVKKEHLLENPCEEVALPKIKKEKIEPLTPYEQKQLEKVAFQNKNGISVILALYTGMRIGEVSGLKWSDIDFVTGVIHVQRTIQRVSGGNGKKKTEVLVDTPKSDSSNRLIPMIPKIKKLLFDLRSRVKSEFVVPCKGKFAEPRVIRARYKVMVEKAGLRYVTFHTLRHTFATRGMEVHMDAPALSSSLGHSSIKMTLDVYTASVLEQRIISMNLLDPLLTVPENAFAWISANT